MSSPLPRPLSWGHINLNVSNLDRSIGFYQLLGFEVLLEGIPYLALDAEEGFDTLPAEAAEALDLAAGTSARGCILQLGNGFPKLDLTELSAPSATPPLGNADRGLVRLCLASRDLAADYERLAAVGVEFLTPPRSCADRMADIALCRDPDGTLIELIQLHLDRWPGSGP
jgi:catechol 2,3-dioxygenase-like lactoylglutathione lyase family enzyme